MPKDDPIPPIGGGGLPEPKQEKKFYKLPFLSYKQTYHFMNLIPVIQLAICFLLFLGSATNIYTISYPFLLQISGFSLLTSIRQWYTSGLMGSCGGVYMSIYGLFALNIIGIAHLIFDFNYYGLYALIVTGIALLLSVFYYRK